MRTGRNTSSMGSGATMYLVSAIIGCRIHNFSMILSEKEDCFHKAIDLKMHSATAGNSSLNPLSRLFGNRLRVPINMLLIFTGLSVSNEGEVCNALFCFLALSICLVNRFNLIQTVGGKINWNCNGGHVGQDSVCFGAHHFQWANVVKRSTEWWHNTRIQIRDASSLNYISE